MMKPIVKSRQRSIRSLLIMSALLVLGYAASQARQTTFEGQPAIALSNGKLDIVVTRLGSTLASIVMTDDPEKLNPLWDPTRIAREQGRAGLQMASSKVEDRVALPSLLCEGPGRFHDNRRRSSRERSSDHCRSRRQQTGDIGRFTRTSLKCEERGPADRDR